MKSAKIPVAACSGIGKALGAAAREAAFVLTEDLRPGKTRIVALSWLVLGNNEARRDATGGPAIAIDGCKLECAASVLRAAGAAEVKKIAVFDVIRRHRGIKPQGVSALNEDGLRLARAAAEEGAKIADEIAAEDEDA